MKKIAVIGSRNWPKTDPHVFWVRDTVEAFRLEYVTYVLVSGGADGASKLAEETALEKGLPVVSFRPAKIHDEAYVVDEWRLYRGQGEIIRHMNPLFRTWDGAAWYRSLLIAERADEGVAFWDGFSRGTGAEIDAFAAEGKPLRIVKP